MLKRKLNNSGDTIVEVLIVILVIASVLASAYSIAVRSLQDTQRTQEHAYALKIAEGQIENLKAALAAGTPGLLTSTTGFCLTDTSFSKTDIAGSPTVNLDDDVYGNYSPAGKTPCRKDPNDPVGNSCATYCYYYGLRIQDSSQPNTFVSSVRWDGVGGVKSQVQLTYKAYK